MLTPLSSSRLDLRMPLLGAAAWLGAVGGHPGHRPGAGVGRSRLAVLVAGAVAVALAADATVVVAVAALLLVAVAAGAVAALRADRVAHNPVADLADDGAAVTVVGTVASDPHVVAGGPQSFAGDQVVWRLAVHQVTGRGRTLDLVAPVLVLGDADDARVPLGATVRLHGRLLSADDRDLAGLLRPSGEAEVIEPPGPWWRAAGAVRQALRDSVAHRPADQRALVPALVDGDDAEVDPGLQDEFRATGLTHLLAVSGTNLTLVVGFLLALARWCRVRGRWLHVVAAAGIVGFVLIARTEPSVLRAAVMGTIGLVALGTDGRHRALRGLGHRGRRAGAARPGAGGLGRLRAVGAGHRRDPAARSGLARRARALAAPVAGRGDRGPGGRPARLHAAGRGDLRAGQPGGGGGQPDGGARWSGRRRCWDWRAGC